MSLSAHRAVSAPPFPNAGLLATLGALSAPSTRSPLLSLSIQNCSWDTNGFGQLPASKTFVPFLKAPIEARPDPVPDPQSIPVLGMLRRGHGRDLIAATLQISASIIDSVAHDYGLTDVADRQFVARRYANAWTVEQYATLAHLWLSGVPAIEIAERLGRSKATIWHKRRYLGLQKRARVYTRVSKVIELSTRQANELLPLSDPQRILTIREMESFTDIERRGRSYYIDNAPDDLTMTFHRSRTELVWNHARYKEISLRVLSGQYMADIARDFGTTLSTIKSVANRVQLKRRTQIELVHHYDPQLAQVNIDKLQIRFRECNSIPNWFFWSEARKGSITSRRYKATREYKDRVASF